jgi:ferric-dicitrate binding protein FerR (iron transport regulator)
VDAAWNRFQKNMTEKPETKIVRGNFSRILAAAAAIAIIIAAFFYINNPSSSQFQTIQTAENEIRQIDLPDGSKVWANQFSKISYSDFKGENRMVKMEGEAFFEVVPNAAKPFIVESGDVKVKVLGTAFNVVNTPGNKSIEVREGKVEVRLRSSNQVFILEKSDRLVLESTKSYEAVLDKGKTENIGGWKSNALVFDNSPLSEVVAQIEHQYEVKIAFRNQNLADCLFKTNFQNASLTEVFEVIETIFKCEIEKKAEGAYVLKGGSCR